MIAAQLAQGLTIHLSGVGYADGGYRYGVQVAHDLAADAYHLRVIDLPLPGVAQRPDVELVVFNEEVQAVQERAREDLIQFAYWFDELADRVRGVFAQATGEDAAAIARLDRAARRAAWVETVQDHQRAMRAHN